MYIFCKRKRNHSVQLSTLYVIPSLCEGSLTSVRDDTRPYPLPITFNL